MHTLSFPLISLWNICTVQKMRIYIFLEKYLFIDIYIVPFRVIPSRYNILRCGCVKKKKNQIYINQQNYLKIHLIFFNRSHTLKAEIKVRPTSPNTANAFSRSSLLTHGVRFFTFTAALCGANLTLSALPFLVCPSNSLFAFSALAR